MKPLTPAHRALLKIMAEQAVREYLTETMQRNQQVGQDRSNQVLPARAVNA